MNGKRYGINASLIGIMNVSLILIKPVKVADDELANSETSYSWRRVCILQVYNVDSLLTIQHD